MAQYLDKKSTKQVEATQIKEGLWSVKYPDGTEKDIAEATFKRWFTPVEGDVAAEPTAAPVELTAPAADAQVAATDAPAEAPAAEPAAPDAAEPAEDEDNATPPQPLSFEDWLNVAHPNRDYVTEMQTRDKSTEEAKAVVAQLEKERKDDYRIYLKGFKGAAEQVAKTEDAAKKAEAAAAKKAEAEKAKLDKAAQKDLEKAAKEVARKAAAEAARAATGDFVLVSHDELKTAKGTKVIDILTYGGQTLTITEYGGFITDVRVADSAGTEVYKSPKMSLKDTLVNHFGMDDDKFKASRSAVTSLRKAAGKPPVEAKVEDTKPAEETPKAEETPAQA